MNNTNIKVKELETRVGICDEFGDVLAHADVKNYKRSDVLYCCTQILDSCENYGLTSVLSGEHYTTTTNKTKLKKYFNAQKLCYASYNEADEVYVFSDNY